MILINWCFIKCRIIGNCTYAFPLFIRKTGQNKSWDFLRIHCNPHTYTSRWRSNCFYFGEAFPLSDTVDISLFGYKSFVVILSTNSNWPQRRLCWALHADGNYAEPVHSLCVSLATGEKKGRAEKWESGSNKLLIVRHWKWEPASENITSQSKQPVFQILCTCGEESLPCHRLS